MKSGNPPGKEGPISLLESGFFHETAEFSRVGEFLYGLGQIGIGPGMARYGPAHEGENSPEIKEIQAPENGVRRFRELQDDHPTAWLENTGEFP